MGKVYHVAVRNAAGTLRFEVEAPNWLDAFAQALERFGIAARVQVTSDYYILRNDQTGADVLVSEADLWAYSHLREVGGPRQARSWLEAREAFGLPFTEAQRDLYAKQREFLL